MLAEVSLHITLCGLVCIKIMFGICSICSVAVFLATAWSLLDWFIIEFFKLGILPISRESNLYFPQACILFHTKWKPMISKTKKMGLIGQLPVGSWFLVSTIFHLVQKEIGVGWLLFSACQTILCHSFYYDHHNPFDHLILQVQGKYIPSAIATCGKAC